MFQFSRLRVQPSPRARPSVVTTNECWQAVRGLVPRVTAFVMSSETGQTRQSFPVTRTGPGGHSTETGDE